MKVLLYSEARTGSTTISKWLSKELGYTLLNEPFNVDMHETKYDKTILNNDNIICKSHINQHNYSHTKIESLNEFLSYFDKIILLKRENIIEQAESYIWLRNEKQVTKQYIITEKFRETYKEDIKKAINDLKERTEILNNINGLNITYENIFYTKSDIDKIKNYLDISEFKFLDILDIKYKFRQEKIKMI